MTAESRHFDTGAHALGKTMKLNGVHVLLTYQCNLECDHCFVFGSPWQTGTFSLANLRQLLSQADVLDTVDWFYFEGGEPFLYYSLLLESVRCAAQRNYKVGIVTNGYWATGQEDAVECLRPFAGLVSDLSISTDLYHRNERQSRFSRNAMQAAHELGIGSSFLTIAQPESMASNGESTGEEGPIRYKGRAAGNLTLRASDKRPWTEFDECCCENLREPGRVHVDPMGNVHICQGISLGSFLTTPLVELCNRYEPDQHPVIGPLLQGGPAQLARRYGIDQDGCFADSCHLCYETRLQLRERFPEILTPEQMYGVLEER